MYPMCSLMASDCVAISLPPTVALPEVGCSRPHSMRMVVDLPAPLGPRNPKISPRVTSRLIWSTATKLPKRFTKSRISTAAGDFSPLADARGSESALDIRCFPYQVDENDFQRGNDLAEMRDANTALNERVLQGLG